MRPKKNRISRLAAVSGFNAVFTDGKLDDIATFFSEDADCTRKRIVELGCGKGSFAAALSAKRNDACILAVEKVTDVILMAMEKAKRENCTNLKFANFDIENILDILPEKYADEIYINFCDPWPKAKNAKRRLTSPMYLERYKKLMKDGAKIFFKTDNAALFEYSLVTFADAGFTLRNVCFDLHGDALLNSENIRTEYEENFSAKGFHINYLEALSDNL